MFSSFLLYIYKKVLQFLNLLGGKKQCMQCILFYFIRAYIFTTTHPILMVRLPLNRSWLLQLKTHKILLKFWAWSNVFSKTNQQNLSIKIKNTSKSVQLLKRYDTLTENLFENCDLIVGALLRNLEFHKRVSIYLLFSKSIIYTRIKHSFLTRFFVKKYDSTSNWVAILVDHYQKYNCSA